MKSKVIYLETRVKDAKTQHDKALALFDLGWQVKEESADYAFDLSIEAEEVSREIECEQSITLALYLRSVCLYLTARYDEALSILLEVKNQFESQGDSLHYGHSLNWIGNCYFRQGDYATALDYYNQSIRIKTGSKDELGLAYSLNDTGAVFQKLGDYSKALEFYQDALKLKESLGHDKSKAYTLNDIGSVYQKLNLAEKAIEYYLASYDIRKKIDDKRGMGLSLGKLGELYFEAGNLEKAEHCFMQSLLYARIVRNRFNETSTLIRYGNLLLKKEAIDKAYEFIDQGSKIAYAIKAKEWIAESHRSLSLWYEAVNNLTEALYHYKQYHSVKEEIYSRDADRRVKALFVQMETERATREAEIYRLKNVELVQANSKLQETTRRLKESDAQKTLLLKQIREQAEILERQTKEDGLTKLYNRRYLDDYLALEFERTTRYDRKLSLAMLDIDHFKKVNDLFSHQVGDVVLRQVAQIIKTNSRITDTTARYGGEEFVLVMPETALENAERVCEKIRQAIVSFDWKAIHPNLQVTISIGIAQTSDDIESYEKILSNADKALYQAKHEGRNRVVTFSHSQPA